jgi:phosphomannomutase
MSTSPSSRTSATHPAPPRVHPGMTGGQMRSYYIEQTAHSLEQWEHAHFPLRAHPPFALEEDDELEFTFTPAVCERIGLRAQVEAFAAEARVSTAGVRENQNVLCPWDHRYRINEYILAIIAEALSKLVVELQAERVANLPRPSLDEIAAWLGADNVAVIESLFEMPLADIVPFVRTHPVRIVGSEVRSNSPRFIDLVSRIYAANGLYVFLMDDERNTKTSAIFMWSFLTYVLGLSGGDYFTSSHGSPQKQSDKILAPDGSQYLPPLYQRICDHMVTILEAAETRGYTIRLAPRTDPHLWRRLTYDKTAKLYASYLRKGPASPGALATIHQATAAGLHLKLDFFGGAGGRTIRSIFQELGILDVFSGGFIREDEDPFFHNIGFRVAPKKGQPGEYEVVHDSVDASLLQVVKTAGYDQLLAEAALGQILFNVDPDVDRFVAAQLVPTSETSTLDALGISWLPLDGERALAVYSPNQFFLMVADNDLTVAQAEGIWESYDNFNIHTYVSAIAWDEWAQRNGLAYIRVPVGFKEIAAIERAIEQAAAQAGPGGSIQVTNERGDVLKLGERPKLHHAGEESGGRIGGPREPIYNVLGESVIGMREKSSGETCLSAVALAARLWLRSQASQRASDYYLHTYLQAIFEDNSIVNTMEFRGDIVHYNEAIVDPAELAAAKAQGIGERVVFNDFFRTLARAHANGCGGQLPAPLGLDQVRALLTEALPGMAAEWQRLERLDLWSDGLQLWFAPGGAVRDICLRPSGTDAKSKVYFDGTDKAYLQQLFEQHLKTFVPAPGALYQALISRPLEAARPRP